MEGQPLAYHLHTLLHFVMAERMFLNVIFC